MSNTFLVVKAALELPDVKLVSIEWMQDSIQKGSKLAESDYLFGSDASASASAGPSTNGGAQVATIRSKPNAVDGANDAESDNDSKAGKKRTRGAKPKAQPQPTVVKDEDAEDEPAPKKTKKAASQSQSKVSKGKQPAKAAKDIPPPAPKQLNIPIDEGCPLAGTSPI